MNKKAFFSAIILIFVLAIFSFFITQKQESLNLKFDDSPRYFALKTEEAYSVLDKSLTMAYVDNMDPLTCKQNVEFETYLIDNFFNFSINEFCDVNYIDVQLINSIPGAPKEYVVDINFDCQYSNDLVKYNYNLNHIFKKKYLTILDLPCKVQIFDVDAGTYYYNN